MVGHLPCECRKRRHRVRQAQRRIRSPALASPASLAWDPCRCASGTPQIQPQPTPRRLLLGLCIQAHFLSTASRITNRVGRFCRTPIAVNTFVVPGTYTSADDGYGLARPQPGHPRSGGLDLWRPMIAPWLPGCSGTPRQHPVSAGTSGFQRTDKIAAAGTCRHRLAPVQEGDLNT